MARKNHYEERVLNRKEVMEKSKTALMTTDNRVTEMFRELERWHKCVAVDGEYFEGDNITFDE